MKLYKSIVLFLAIIMSLGMVNGVVTDEDLRNGTSGYWTHDDDFIIGSTSIDSVGYQNGSINGAIKSNISIIGQSLNFTSQGDNVNLGTTFGDSIFRQGDFSVALWGKKDNICNGCFLFDYSESVVYIGYEFLGSNGYEANIFDGSHNTITSGITNNEWNHFVLTYNSSSDTLFFYANNISQGSLTGVLTPSQEDDQASIGGVPGGIRTFFGAVDEVGVWNRSLSTDEIEELYTRQVNDVIGAQYDFNSSPTKVLQFQNISVNNQTLINNTFFSTNELNFSTIVQNTSTNGNVNQTYFLWNNGNLTQTSQFATNNVNGSFQLNLAEGNYNISFLAINNETNTSTGNYSFSVDLTPPTINNTLPAEINTYTLGNISNYVQCNDIGMGTCKITFQPDNITLNNTENYTFTLNGNQTYMINATDDAGNSVEETGVILVNPNQYFRVRNELISTFLTSYEFITTNGTYESIGEYITIPIYDLGLGTHDLLFSKTGYVNETNQVTFNTTSQLNQTFNVTPVTLSIQMFNADNVSEQLTFDLTILNDTFSKTYLNQVNFSDTYENLPHNDIEIIIESSGYSNAYFFQTLTEFTSISITGYMISINNSDVVTFQINDKTTDEPLDEVLIEAQQLINGTYQTISQGQTGTSGQGFLFLDITRKYKFIFSKDNYVQAVSESIPGVTSYTIRLQPEGSSFNFIDGVSYAFKPDGGVLYDNENYNLTGFISGTSISSMLYEVVLENGTVLYNTSSSNPTGTTFTYELSNWNSSTYTGITQRITYIKDGNTNILSKEYRTTSIGAESFIYFLKFDFAQSDSEDDELFRWLVMIISIGGSLLVGRLVASNLLGNSLLVIAVSGFFTYISWMPEIYFGAIATLAILIYVGGKIIA